MAVSLQQKTWLESLMKIARIPAVQLHMQKFWIEVLLKNFPGPCSTWQICIPGPQKEVFDGRHSAAADSNHATVRS
jgi:hypothetical protein